MRFWTIWSIPCMSIKERLLRTREWGAMTIAAHLPKRVRYWTTMIELGRATAKSDNVMAEPLDSILQNLDAPKHVA